MGTVLRKSIPITFRYDPQSAHLHGFSNGFRRQSGGGVFYKVGRYTGTIATASTAVYGYGTAEGRRTLQLDCNALLHLLSMQQEGRLE